MAALENYDSPQDLPPVIPVFPLAGALLLPRGQMPLNIFEPRYLAMVDHTMASGRIIGMVQPRPDCDAVTPPPICEIGCCGRITSYHETSDGRYVITLTGISRFTVVEELATTTAFRQCRISAEQWRDDFTVGSGEEEVDRKHLLATFRAYLEANKLEADWSSISEASNEALVNALSMMSPYGAAEKQALLEAPDLKTRADTLVAITEVALQRDGEGGSPTLQ